MSITDPSRARIAFILFASRFVRKKYESFVEGIGLQGDETVMDFGAGWGENTRNIAEKLDKGGKVVALDVSRQWQDVVRKRLQGFSNVELVNADVRSAGLPDATFDVIVIHYVLHDIPRRERLGIVRELAKKLKPHGFIELREPTRLRHGMPVTEIKSLMAGNNLKESRTKIVKGEFQARFSK
jgi:ubiquinone/menaquinone biosynthesis C-methylase UbiE